MNELEESNSEIIIYYSVTEYEVSIKLECEENLLFRPGGSNRYGRIL